VDVKDPALAYDAYAARLEGDAIAALGTSLVLLARSGEILAIEVDDRGRCTWTERFALDQRSDAIARLYERHAEQISDGPERARATAIARAVAVLLGPPAPEAFGAQLALDVHYRDHRLLGWGTVHGVLSLRRGLRTIWAGASWLAARTDEILGLRADALLVQRTISGVNTSDGAPFVRRPLALWTFAADGRVHRWEHFDEEDREAALARFAELAAPPARRFFENAATRALTARPEVLATRGDRLALSSESDSLIVTEIGADGSRAASVRFDPAAREAAFAELDRRYAIGEAAPHLAAWLSLVSVRRALVAGDWGEVVCAFSPDLVAVDHRPLGWRAMRSPEAFVANVRAVAELRPDLSLRLEHLQLGARAVLFLASWSGGASAVAFDIPAMSVFAKGDDGRVGIVHLYGVEQLDAARAQFAALSS
jgi:hypothetical protein